MNKVILFLTSVIAAVFMVIPVLIETVYSAFAKAVGKFAFKTNYERIQKIVKERTNPSALFKDISWGRYGKVKISH